MIAVLLKLPVFKYFALFSRGFGGQCRFIEESARARAPVRVQAPVQGAAAFVLPLDHPPFDVRARLIFSPI